MSGGKCSKPTSNSLSFSITKSVVTKHPVDVTSPHIARDCQPMLQLHYRHRSDGWTGQYETSVVGCVWEAAGRANARAGGHVSLQSLLVSLHAPPHGSESWGPVRSQNMDGRATRYTAALVDRWVATTMSSPTVNLCRLQMIWLSFWTVSWQWLDTFRPFAVQPFSSYVSCGLFAISDDQGDACLSPGLHYNTITSPQ